MTSWFYLASSTLPLTKWWVCICLKGIVWVVLVQKDMERLLLFQLIVALNCYNWFKAFLAILKDTPIISSVCSPQDDERKTWQCQQTDFSKQSHALNCQHCYSEASISTPDSFHNRSFYKSSLVFKTVCITPPLPAALLFLPHAVTHWLFIFLSGWLLIHLSQQMTGELI